MNKKKSSYSSRKCKVRINIRKFESILMTSRLWGFQEFLHCLN
ncbi:MAG: hypothetical protein ACKVOR_06550 [Flavobacteriales bacterium]